MCNFNLFKIDSVTYLPSGGRSKILETGIIVGRGHRAAVGSLNPTVLDTPIMRHLWIYEVHLD